MLARYGLVCPSFVAPPRLEELRRLTRLHARTRRVASTLRNMLHRMLDESGLRIDPHDGTLTKDATQWTSDAVPTARVKHAEMSFASSGEPWVYCASHYRTDRELRRLRKDFAKRDRSAVTGIADPNTFATWLGINFALTLDKDKVGLHAHGQLLYALSRYGTNRSQGSARIDTWVYVYHGPVHYEDSSGRVATQEDLADPNAAPKAWFTKKMCFETQTNTASRLAQ